jgi:hypothetical protein
MSFWSAWAEYWKASAERDIQRHHDDEPDDGRDRGDVAMAAMLRFGNQLFGACQRRARADQFWKAPPAQFLSSLNLSMRYRI